MSKVLIVVDMQNDFVTGSLGTPEAKGIIPNVLEKVQQYMKNEEYRVIFTRDAHNQFYLETQEGKHLPIPHCIIGTEGWNIIPELDRHARNSFIVNKDTFGHNYWEYAFDLEENNFIFPIESIELVGVCTDICVISNALILKTIYPETPIIVDASCCAGTTPENHNAALQVMKSCQIEVKEKENEYD